MAETIRIRNIEKRMLRVRANGCLTKEIEGSLGEVVAAVLYMFPEGAQKVLKECHEIFPDGEIKNIKAATLKRNPNVSVVYGNFRGTDCVLGISRVNGDIVTFLNRSK
ncbi:MAG: hypothetical protein Q8P80_03195 [Candidatus Levybacteria bacterium]|nr:hypothetical protein [Candidatus Levybacteria bacterium]